MPKFVSNYLHQDVLSLQLKKNVIFAGVGGCVKLYCDNTLRSTLKIFEGQQIHILKVDNNNNILVAGGKRLVICKWDESLNFVVSPIIHYDDWILDLVFHDDGVLLVSAHNEVQKWLGLAQGALTRQSVSRCNERCLLYSNTLYHSRATNEVIAFAGTVYSEVLVWKPNLNSNEVQPVLQRLVGHKGVIFSIAVREISSNYHIVSTTSDDRSVRIWTIDGDWGTATVSVTATLFGHNARVWKSIITPEYIVSIGEDSLLCLWSFQGRLVNKINLHQGGGIRAIAYDENCFVTGGGDGGISRFHLNYVKEYSSPKIEHPIKLDKGEIPRKVKFVLNGFIVLTNRGRILNQNGDTIAESVDLIQCTDMDASPCRKFIALSTVKGYIHVYDATQRNTKMAAIDVGKRTLCKVIRWRSDKILANIDCGKMVLLYVEDSFVYNEIGNFILPKSRDCCLTCFACFGTYLLVGDRAGSLHVYDFEKEVPKQTLKRLHSFLGMSDILVHGDTVLTAGAGGWIRELTLEKDVLFLARSYSVPLESVSKILQGTHGIFVLGFLGADFKVWDLYRRFSLVSYNCGGGHRSWDVNISEHSLEFLFIKDKLVSNATFELHSKFDICDSFHFKTINCLRILSDSVFVSGSEDNTIRIGVVENGAMTTLSILEQHISSVRALSVCPISGGEMLIVAAGGREQISLTSFNPSNRQCRQLLTHFPTDDAAAEGRFMCLATHIKQDGGVLILAGCSDCTVRTFLYKNELWSEVAIFHYTRCVLQVYWLETATDLFAMALTTDGAAIFWTVSEVSINPTENPKRNKLHLHDSGINSFLIQRRSSEEFLLVTGGDDNIVMMSIIAYDSMVQTWKLLSSWRTDSVHSAQVTGLVLCGDILFSTGIDQILAVHRIEVDNGVVSAAFIFSTRSTVPDIHGMEAIKETNRITLYLYGKGIEVINVNLDELDIR